MTSIYCIGELLIDFISPEHGHTLQEAVIFEKKAGGAPANVAVAAARLGVKTYFLGQVGVDEFGQFLRTTLERESVDMTHLIQDGKTTLAFVSLAADGERSFDFFRGGDGDYVLQDEIESKLKQGDIVHFGSATGFLPGALKQSYYRLLQLAVEKGSFIVFDPNYRDLLISDNALFQEDCYAFMKSAHLIKLSEEEALLLTGAQTLKEALVMLDDKTEGVIVVTLGSKGTLVHHNKNEKTIPSIRVDSIDTTGAGDCFIGTLIGQIGQLDDAADFFKEEVWTAFVRHANVAGALTCTKYGAIAALPTQEEVERRKGVDAYVG